MTIVMYIPFFVYFDKKSFEYIYILFYFKYIYIYIYMYIISRN